jgi:hypothetical protein
MTLNVVENMSNIDKTENKLLQHPFYLMFHILYIATNDKCIVYDELEYYHIQNTRASPYI